MLNCASNDEDVLFYLIQQGADWCEQVELESDDGSPFDLSGGSARLDVFRSFANPTPFLTLQTADGTMTLDGSRGKLNWLVAAAQVATFQGTTGMLSPRFGYDRSLVPFGFYNLRAKWASGQIARALSGQIALSIGPQAAF